MFYKILQMPVLILAALVFVACSGNEILGEDPTEQIPVTFTVSTLNVDTQPMSRAGSATSGDALSDVVNSISILIYNSSSLSKMENLSSSFTPGVDQVPDNFGTFSVKLSPGTYKILAYAKGKGTQDLPIFNYDTFNSDLYFGNMYNREAFYYTGEITVSQDQNSYQINLARKGALLRVHLLDAAEDPDQVSSVEVKFSTYSKWKPVSPTEKSSYDQVNRTQTTATNEDGTLDPIDCYIPFLNGSPLETSVTIKVIGSDSKTLLSRSLTVNLYENRRTVISGALLSLIGTKELSITVDDLWGEDNNVSL